MTVQAPGDGAFEAQLVNLSVGGAYLRSDRLLVPGASIDLRMELEDGAAPVSARGEVVWVRTEGEEGPPGMAVRFVDLRDSDTFRITRLVAKKRREPTGTVRRDVRVRLPTLPSALRAVARDITAEGVMLEAELPWLKLGGEVDTELNPGELSPGRVSWVGLDVTRGGAARLRIYVDFLGEGAEAPSREAAPPTAEPYRAPAPRRASSGLRWLLTSLSLFTLASLSALFWVVYLKPPPTPVLLPSPVEAEHAVRPPPSEPTLTIPKQPTAPTPPPPKRRVVGRRR